MHNLRPWIVVSLLVTGLLACGGVGAPSATPIPFPTLASAPTSTLPPTIPPIIDNPGVGGGGGTDLQVINTVFLPRSDGWRLLGEVANNSGAAVSNVGLTIDWLDAAGNALGSDIAYPLVVNIAPGETAPFIYNIYDASLQLGSFRATVSQFTAIQTLARAELDVEHAFLSVDQFGDFHCTGELANNGPAPASIVGLAATVLDRNNALVSADSVWAAVRHLPPGERTPFRISPVGFSGATGTDYTCRIFIDALVAEPIDVGNVAVAGDLLYYLDAFGSSHLVGQIANNSNTPVSATVVAGLYDANGNVIDADFASPPIYIQSGQSLPFDFTTLNATKFNPDLRARVNGFAVMLDPSTVLPGPSQIQLATRNDAASFESGALTVTTEVVNDQAAQVDYAFLIARVTDGTGRLVGSGYITTDPIPPGGAVSASVPVYIDPGLDPNTLVVTTVAYVQRP